MFLDIPFHADLILLNKFCQNKIDQCLLKANANCIARDYWVGDEIYCLTAQKSKAHTVYTIPHQIHTVHTRIVMAMASSGAMVTTYSSITQQRA